MEPERVHRSNILVYLDNLEGGLGCIEASCTHLTGMKKLHLRLPAVVVSAHCQPDKI